MTTSPRWQEGSAGRRVLMMVDNGIEGDSRVQKQARSMADRGWDVVLAGGTHEDSPPPVDLDLGGARAHLVHVSQRAVALPTSLRSTLWRNPLAYSSVRRQRFADGRADAAVRRAISASALARAEGRVAGGRRLAHRLHTASALARRRLVDHRITVSTPLRDARTNGTGRLDRAATAWWRTVLGDRCWERLDPQIWEWELAFGPFVDALRPDVIHANDHRMLHVAARAKSRAAARGREVKVVWDAHEYVPGIAYLGGNLRWRPAQVALERQFAPAADAVVTVSDELADMLHREHHLLTRPEVVLNAPDIRDPAPCPTDVRRACGLDDQVPLVVYSGNAAAQRGVDVVVESLPDLPDVHVALVVLRSPTTPPNPYTEQLLRRARELDVIDRVHPLPYVPAREVPSFLATADVGVYPGLRFVNHEISLNTKFMEYSHARLPLVVSDLRTIASTVRSTGQGEVFEPADVDGYVAAVRKVLADKAAYQRAYDDDARMASWTWERQADVLDAVYRQVTAAEPEPRHG